MRQSTQGPSDGPASALPGNGHAGQPGRNLARQYALASLPVILALTLFTGWWVNRAIEKEVIANTAANVALYVQGFLAPKLQGLADRDRLSEAEIEGIETLLSDSPLGKRIQSVKIWKQGGLIAYYSRRAFIGERFEPTDNLKKAWSGTVAAEFDDLRDHEDSEEAKLGVALLEVYSPVREQGEGRIIAVAEFYQEAQLLSRRLAETRRTTWLVVISSALCAYGLLFVIVQGGSRIIRRQREALKSQVHQLSLLLEQNKQLELSLRRAARRTTEINEQLLSRVSADLHDGPAQSMGLALLRLDAMEALIQDAARSGGGDKSREAEKIGGELRHSLMESMTELRNISRGLALPDLADLSLAETIRRVVAAHNRRTHSQVRLADIGPQFERQANMSEKLTVYRVIQEALMNAYRHAEGKGLEVKALLGNDELRLSIRDEGPGFEPQAHSDRLGLRGLRERIESLGGRFRIDSAPGRGTVIEAALPLSTTP
jgi:signal transduction histidine kinase